MIQLSTVQLLLYRNLCDYLPMNEKHHHLHKEWILTNPPKQNNTTLIDPDLPHTPQPENIEITLPM